MKNYILLLLTVFMFVGAPVFSQPPDANALYKEGLSLKEQKKINEAVERFRLALRAKPDYTEARYEMGWCMNDLKEYDKALINLRMTLPVWAKIPKVHFEMGWAYEKLGKTDSAILSYNQCLQLKPDYSGVYRQLGGIYYNNNENETALSYLNSYEKFAKDSVRDYLHFYRKGFCYNAVKKYDSAVISLNRSLRYKTDYLNTWLELGFAHSRLKKADEAIGYFRKAIELDPKSHVGYNGIGEVYRDIKKDMNESMNWYRKALEVKPKERKACFGMGYCLNSQQKYSEAISYLRTAIEQENTYTAAYVELGYALYKTGSYGEAETMLQKALVLNSTNENGRYYLVLLYITQKNKTKAQQVVDELRKMSSRYTAELQEKVDKM